MSAISSVVDRSVFDTRTIAPVLDGGNKYFAHINSNDRLTGTSSDFQIDLHVGAQSGAVYSRVCVIQLSIPKSFYTVRANFNSFILDEGGLQQTVTLDPGNYNLDAIIVAAKNKLDAASVANGNSWVYGVSYPAYTEPATGKLTFTVSGNGGVQPLFIFGPDSASIVNEQLGFLENTSNAFVANTITSVSVINLNSAFSVQLISNCTDNQNQSLQFIMSASTDFSIITYQATDIAANSKVLRRNMPSLLRFAIVDERYRPIDLNGVPFNCVLLFY
jgi:hypothetical protein